MNVKTDVMRFAVAFLLTASSVWASPSVYPKGTTVYDPQKAYNTYVVFDAPDGKTHLIDMNGNEVHRWEKIGAPSEILNPAVTGGKKGELLVQLSSIRPRASGEFRYTKFGDIFFNNFNKTIGELDWDGNVVWEWGSQAPGGAAMQSHDWDRLPGGNTLIVATVNRVIPSLGKKSLSDQVIYEITPHGDIAWKWSVADHVSEFGISPGGLKLLRAYLADGDISPGFLTINDMQPIGPNKWFDAGDTRFAPENIVIDSRDASFIAIIDKKSGKIVWRLGPDYPADKRPPGAPLSRALPRPVDQTSGQHDAHIIPKGLPGAGNLLVFDNEGASGLPLKRLDLITGSRVLEIDPTTKQIVWQYTGLDSNQPNWAFNSFFISSARRLPNGNTLINEGINGRFFQITPSGEIVWEYINPYFALQPIGDKRAISTNWVFRAQPVPYDWVPEGTPHSEIQVRPIAVSAFRVP